jgi:uncharacterized glyoxalase superfamily protein PhnB
MTSPFTASVFYRDPLAAMKWLEQAFGFEIGLLVTDETGNLGHAEMSYAGGASDIGGEWSSQDLLAPASLKSPASLGGVGTQFVRVRLESGLDRHCEHARAAGAGITQEPQDQFYGDRIYRALDPGGHVWTFSEAVAEVSIQDMERASGLKIAAGRRGRSDA